MWYQYGFDEASGNFQKNNYGRGGTGEDFVLADGLDGSGTNNANFGTPPDGQKPRMQMYLWNSILVNSPAAIKGTYKAARAQFGPTNYTVTEQLVLVDDGSADPTYACNALINAAEVTGKIALVDRGSCDFLTKCMNAQNAGAIAVLVCNNVSGDPFAMTAGANGSSVTIPSVMISLSACNILKANLAAGINVTLKGPELDGSFDNVIISHEYGHGISTRLTGGAANSSCLSNQEQMGEGWSDWFGLMLTMKAGHTGSLGRGIGTYVTTQDTSANGIRPYRYSTQLSTNPQTYDYIKTSSIPHGVGSVWCSMLWEVTWALIDQYGFDPDLYHGNGGNNMAMALVIEALKLQPCTPGFVDGRDAILLADQVLYGGANKCLIWQAFAKRGLGLGAIQGSSHSVSDGTEAFDVPVDCNRLVFTNTPSSFYLAPGDTIHYDIKLKNLHNSTITGIIIKDTLDDLLIPVSASNGAVINGQEVVYPSINLAPVDSVLYRITSKIAQNQNVQADSFYEDVEIMSGKFQSVINNTLLQGWTRSSTNPNGGSFSWFVPDHPSPSVANLTMAIPERLSKGSKLQFWHKFNTESNWDGGRVYISVDGQNTWQNLGPYMTENWYNGYLNNISSQTAFSGSVQNYIRTTIDLSSFDNKTVYIRFQMYSDLADGGQGWFIDDILLTNTQRSVWNVATQTNTPQYNSSANVKTPTVLLPCQTVYVLGDSGQGSLRNAIGCANIGDTISIIEDILNDTITLTSSTLTLDKNMTFKTN
ncbi:MAG: M36 family metallopeptidase [Saprospiraceae bacterium]|nr:M36 family metallopeptidase [Saprospiraceae bacterium]